ncbi:FAD/NAD(P)-binding domain-containing protein [Suillus occidentalis]|nr:FAD/NAD(P)-binding domain-containing protein [Suillus occidentalis]
MTLQPKNLLIIGGGPCGLITLRNCLHRGTFTKVQLVERHDDVGGVWYQSHASDHRERWATPAYPGLIGNVIPEFLSFSEHPFPAPPREHQPFPTLAETNAYLKEFARPFIANGHIRLSFEVIGVDELEGGGWTVHMKDWNEGGVVFEETWDAVVITTVWFDNPHFPDVPGLQELQQKKPNKVQHAMNWMGPQGDYEAKRVLVIGNANSANEMAAQLTPVAQTPIYRSTRRISVFPSLPDTRIQDIGPISLYTINDNDKITAHVQDGTTVDNIDIVLFGTGYYPHVPYLRVLHPDPDPQTCARKLVPLTSRTTVPTRIPSLDNQIIYAHNPTLAFVGAPTSFIPFTLADLTSTWLSLAWSGLIPIPPTPKARLAYEQGRLRTLAEQRSESDNPSDLINFHFLGRYEMEYARGLREDIVRVRDGLDGVLARWDDEQDGRRFAMYAKKLESLFVSAGVERQIDVNAT